MAKIKSLNNELINKRRLLKLAKSFGINRVNSKAIVLIQEEVSIFVKDILSLSIREMKIMGLKTLKKENISNATRKMKKEERFYDV